MKKSKEHQPFKIRVSTGIFEHRRKLREAHWLFLYFIDKTTYEFTDSEGRRMGQVLYGRPCLDSHAASAFRCSVYTVARWRNLLARFGYITQRWTGRGWAIAVNKSKKWDWKVSGQTCPPSAIEDAHGMFKNAHSPMGMSRTAKSDLAELLTLT
jgi:hypothetical protein